MTAALQIALGFFALGLVMGVPIALLLWMLSQFLAAGDADLQRRADEARAYQEARLDALLFLAETDQAGGKGV